ncbi:hypothetical protein IE81DRAFT_369599 [Ceraceosorus guamensis]|uniref:Cytosolic Fe-S cluster assembly factor NBP35 n=1 Tax=Ceraceosorus guamensis TaxID=1522189 RepID=A0A316VTD1_9BASI|nr:hypothetical protein IE81DRAFT_369599 [Ceraceosorus guamensis]PWN38775.1 hypothetical protein IE81DRAFT_369599 [Ceraceosorus guamensis]
MAPVAEMQARMPVDALSSKDVDAVQASAAAAVVSSAAAPETIAKMLPDTIPENAPEHCPGTDSDQAGKASACQGCANQSICSTAPKGPDPDLPRIGERMKGVRNKILVMSGKGGVGKSTFTSMLAWACASDAEKQVSE